VGTVHQLHGAGQGVTLARAVGAYLGTLNHDESKGTRRMYASILNRLTGRFGESADPASIPADDLAAWFGQTWGQSAPSTWNVALDAVRSACKYWADQGWLTSDPAVMLRRRKVAPDRSRALSRADMERLLTSDKYPLRDRTLWRMLYETAARSAEVLRLNVEDLDLANRKAKVRRKGGAQDVIVWQTGTARLLPRLLDGRKAGPVFLTDRKGKGHADGRISAADLAPDGRARLSYRQAEDVFKAATADLLGKPCTLHQLRHSALTHDAEAGASTAMLMTKSGHQAMRTLGKYARPSVEALQRFQEATDPARRR
jgi:integrase/recombinase XerC/integrase/recombinase XerD